MRLPALFLLAALAPMQCTRAPDPARSREDTAGDGLWALAEDFKARGDQQAHAATLRFLVARYPSSRRATQAREELAAPAPASP